MGLQDVARGQLHEDKLHQGCLANPLTPSSITLCRSLSPTHARSVSTKSRIPLTHCLSFPLSDVQYYEGWMVVYPNCFEFDILKWRWKYFPWCWVFIAHTQRLKGEKNTPKTECTFSDLRWLSWFVQTVSQSKKNRVSVFDTEDERLGGLECLTEKENSLSTEIHVLPLFSQGKYLFFLLMLNCCH